ncbi:type I methionyl aminopeptidase [Candidatus Saccharibacteria bacterium]|nr:MAG: type I methionyl aminopeptidase [Candidatus Saccharibacteria bacterium]
MLTKVKTAQEIVAMRESGRQLATVLQYLSEEITPGMTTKDLADLAAAKLKQLGGKPAFLGYYGFPDVLCVSVNSEVVHGIPGNYVIQDGDIVSMDFGVVVDKMITDGAITVVAGTTKNQKVSKLISATEQSLYAGIEQLKGGVRVGTVANAIEKVLKKQQLGIVRDLVGHGVGHELHEDPNIPNYGQAQTGPVLQAGMTIAIEPMATLGTEKVYCDRDGWTIKTADDSLAAHFEHTILITEHGYEILTQL